MNVERYLLWVSACLDRQEMPQYEKKNAPFPDQLSLSQSSVASPHWPTWLPPLVSAQTLPLYGICFGPPE